VNEIWIPSLIKHIFSQFYLPVYSLQVVFIMIEKIYQTLETVFHRLYKHKLLSKILCWCVVYSTLFSVFGYPDERNTVPCGWYVTWNQSQTVFDRHAHIHLCMDVHSLFYNLNASEYQSQCLHNHYNNYTNMLSKGVSILNLLSWWSLGVRNTDISRGQLLSNLTVINSGYITVHRRMFFVFFIQGRKKEQTLGVNW